MNPLPPSAHRESDVRPPTQHSDAPREQEEAWEEACRSDSEAALGEAGGAGLSGNGAPGESRPPGPPSGDAVK